jgi:hypothetical protein
MPGSHRKRSMFSPAVLLQVKRFVARDFSAAEIAEKIGCKLGTLRVKCSENGISLRRRSAPVATPQGNGRKRLVISLQESVALGLQKQADKEGMSISDLAAALLEAIACDNLYDAVIDLDVESKKPKASRASRRSKTGSD